jgi:hypothetical protein
VIERQPALVLPLVDHLVEQRGLRGIESVAAEVQRRDRDLAPRPLPADRVVPQPPAHAA